MKENARDALQGNHAYGNVTSFVRSPNHLCVAITRPQFELIVFRNKSSLIGHNKPLMNHTRYSLALLVTDAMDRGSYRLITTT
jgi:hypothetical protein